MKKLKSILTASLLLFIAPSWAVENSVKQGKNIESVEAIDENEISFKDYPSEEELLKNGLFFERLIKGNIKQIYEAQSSDIVTLKNNVSLAIYGLGVLDVNAVRIKGRLYFFKNPVFQQLLQNEKSKLIIKPSHLIEECKECVDYLTKGEEFLN